MTRAKWAALGLALTLGSIVLVASLSASDGPRVAAPSSSPAVATVAATSSPTPTTSSSPSPTAVPSPSATAGSSERFGVVTQTEGVAPPLLIRPETSAQATDTINGVAGHAVSPDGRQIAAWLLDAQDTPRRLVTLTIGASAQPTMLLELPPNERGGEVAWASDGSALTIGVQSAAQVPGVGGGPTTAFWRAFDLRTRVVSEMAQRSDGRLFIPIAWVRGSGEFAAAFETGEGGYASAYYLWRPGAPAQRSAMPGGSALLVSGVSVRASADGRRVAAIAFGREAVTQYTVLVWPTDDPARATALRPATGDTVSVVALRPGSDEIGVDSGPMAVGSPGVRRFELWSMTGQRRVVRDSGGFEVFRFDGSAAISRDGNVIDLTSGRATPLAGASARQRYLSAVLLR